MNSQTLPGFETVEPVFPPRSNYDKRKDRERERQANMSASGRDIGELPEVVNPERRAACERDLALYCKTYNPEAFCLPWSKNQLKAIKLIEEAVFHGHLFALAMERGSGKTTLLKMALMWATSYGHRRFGVILGNNDEKAKEIMSDIQLFFQYLPLLAEDFPEIVYPITCLENIANRAAGQTYKGKPTLIKLLPNVMSFPMIEGSKTSGIRIICTGMTGKGIRGTAKALPSGEIPRPDFVLIDDPQDDESAASPSQNEKKLRLLSGAVLGMAGPGKTISGVACITVILENDMADQLLNRDKHPEWGGVRTQMLPSMPTNLKLWNEYYKVYEGCFSTDPKDFRPANDFYIANREALDEGAEASWPVRYLPSEVSAIQHAMNLKWRDERAFWAEYQNNPGGEIDDDEKAQALTIETVLSKVNGLNRRQLAPDQSILVAGIDVHDEVLYFGIAGFSPSFTGGIIDYGTYPEQHRTLFSLRSAPVKISDKHKGGKKERVLAALMALTKQLVNREFRIENGGVVKIGRILIDAGYLPELVDKVRRKYSIVMPSRGVGIKAGNKPMAEYAKRPGERHGDNWLLTRATSAHPRTCRFDTNHWKTQMLDAWQTLDGATGALTIWGTARTNHALYASHIAESEYFVETEGYGRKVKEWHPRPERPDNHWLDNTVQCFVAASVEGAVYALGDEEPAETQKPVSFAELQRERQRARQERRGQR